MTVYLRGKLAAGTKHHGPIVTMNAVIAGHQELVVIFQTKKIRLVLAEHQPARLLPCGKWKVLSLALRGQNFSGFKAAR